MSELTNVRDRRYQWIGGWTTAPLDYDQLSEADVGRTVIYQDHGRREAGWLSSWRDGIVFARYDTGDTAAGASPESLCFGIARTDLHPDTPKGV